MLSHRVCTFLILLDAGKLPSKVALHFTQQWNKSTYFIISCQLLILANHFWQAKWRKMLPHCLKVHSTDDQWGQVSFHDHWWFEFSPLWQMSSYPCVTPSDVKPTPGSSLQKSCLVTQLAGPLPSLGVPTAISHLLQGLGKALCGRGGIPVAFLQTQKT